jgi:hypothetical protein
VPSTPPVLSLAETCRQVRMLPPRNPLCSSNLQRIERSQPSYELGLKLYAASRSKWHCRDVKKQSWSRGVHGRTNLVIGLAARAAAKFASPTMMTLNCIKPDILHQTRVSVKQITQSHFGSKHSYQPCPQAEALGSMKTVLV